MSITARHARTRLAAASTILDDLVDRLPAAVTNATLAITEPDHDKPRAEDAGIRGRHWISDPTGDTATNRTTSTDIILGDLNDQIGSLALTLSLLVTFTERWTHAEPAGGPHRRCGEMTPRGDTIAAWFDPTCTRSAIGRNTATGWHWDAHGLCEACYRRKRRHEQAEAVA